MTACVVAARPLAGLLVRLARLGRGQLDTATASLRQPDGDRLLRRTRTVLALPYVTNLFANERSRLRRRRFLLGSGASRPRERCLRWHVEALQ
jgi:hypothetical protein